MAQRNFELDYCKICPTHLADGLFVPRRNENKKTDISKKFDNGVVRFVGYTQMGCFDQSVLLSVCSRTGLNGLLIKGDEVNLDGNEIQLELPFLNKKGEVSDSCHTTTKTKASAIFKDMGYNNVGEKDYKKLKESLFRLSNISVLRITNDGRYGSMNLLDFDSDKYGQIVVFLNWRLAGAILGGLQNIQISLRERRSLNSSVSRILHAWLSANVRRGTSLMNNKGTSLDRLCIHVWGKDFENNAKNAKSNKRQRVKKALQEIDNLAGWDITFNKVKVFAQRSDDLHIEAKK